MPILATCDDAVPTISKRSVSLYCRNAYKVVYALVSNGANPELKPKPNAFKCAEMTALECAVKLGYDESEHAIEEGIKKFHKEVRLLPFPPQCCSPGVPRRKYRVFNFTTVANRVCIHITCERLRNRATPSFRTSHAAAASLDAAIVRWRAADLRTESPCCCKG